jgi:DNA-binding beta-propeller fold protein YncE
MEFVLCCTALACCGDAHCGDPRGTSSPDSTDLDRSPVDLVVGPGDLWVVSVNQSSDTVSLVSLPDGRVLDEQKVGGWPVAIARSEDGSRVVVSSRDAGELAVFELERERLRPSGRIRVGFHPHGVALDRTGRTAFVALTALGQVVVVDIESGEVTDRIDVGRWPRYLALSPDGTRLAVGVSGDLGVSMIDVAQRKLAWTEAVAALNVGHLVFSPNGEDVFFPWMIYRRTPITPSNIRLGWVLGSRIARMDTGDDPTWQALTLDPSGRAVADPHGIALTPDTRRIVVSASGTQELLVFRREGLPFQGHALSDHIDRSLLADGDRFFRISLGGRPMAVRSLADNQRVVVANYLRNSLQIVDLDARQTVFEVPLGGSAEPSLARRGEAIFYDATRSLDQWYSCHSCHYEGGTNAVTMNTPSDGSELASKTVLPLYRLDRTGPWTWHGWQTDLHDGIRNSLTSTMQGPVPSEDDVQAMAAYFSQLEPPPNPNHSPDAQLAAAVERGRQIFHSSEAGCITCHQGPELTDGQIHDVGTGRRMDRYHGYNTPTLRNVYHKTLLLHDGRAKSLEEVLTGVHRPSNVAGSRDLGDQELADLIEYLKSL